jgi:hypothetical protein
LLRGSEFSSEKVTFTHLASNFTKPRPPLVDDLDDGIYMNQRVVSAAHGFFVRVSDDIVAFHGCWGLALRP